MRRIALFSDIHANLQALDAVLGDIQEHRLGEVYCLGDLVGYGPDPGAVVARIRSARIPTVRGNYDDGIAQRRGECGCYYATQQAISNGQASYSFTDAALDDADREWLASLPSEFRFTHGGARILLVHGSPRKINEYLLPDRSEGQLARLADEAEADVICIGHVHVPYHRAFQAADGRQVHYVSAGSVGKPKDGDPRATWVELLLGMRDEILAASEDPDAARAGNGETWLAANIHRTRYDIEAVMRAMHSAGLPPSLADSLRSG